MGANRRVAKPEVAWRAPNRTGVSRGGRLWGNLGCTMGEVMGASGSPERAPWVRVALKYSGTYTCDTHI